MYAVCIQVLQLPLVKGRKVCFYREIKKYSLRILANILIWLCLIQVQCHLPALKELRDKSLKSLKSIRQDHKRALNPTPYKVGLIFLLQLLRCDMRGGLDFILPVFRCNIIISPALKSII